MNPYSYCLLTFDKVAKNMEKRQSLHKTLLEKVVICLQKTKTRSMSDTLYYYEFKVD
jgi:hypothetical protein